MQKHNSGIGPEHRLCDLVQLIMLTLFFVIWIADLSLHLLGLPSSVLLQFVTFPLLVLPAIFTSGFGVYLVLNSHGMVFGKNAVKSEVIDFGVYSWIRHPMYLGSLMLCLGFFFASLSMVALAVLVVFFVAYDKMTEYEEQALVQKLGDEYVAYKTRVPKWFPKFKK
jgi:protein-S-isoprenylcysteine O-methyltransferase Ste14